MSVLLRGVKNWVFWGILRNLCSGMKTLGTLEGIYEVCMFLQFKLDWFKTNLEHKFDVTVRSQTLDLGFPKVVNWCQLFN